LEENYHIGQVETPTNVGLEEPSQWERKPSASASMSAQRDSTVVPTPMENNDDGWTRKKTTGESRKQRISFETKIQHMCNDEGVRGDTNRLTIRR
jgi:hypothetical protein